MSFFANLRQHWQETKVRESAKLKNMTFKEKVRYIYDNWSLEIIVAITAIALVIVAITWTDNATNKFILSFSLSIILLTIHACTHFLYVITGDIFIVFHHFVNYSIGG